MNNKEQMLGMLLNKIADELNISATMQEKAIRSYEAVGKWIGEGINYDVKIMPQGSMNLGTVVRPIDDSDDYDVDLVCLLKNGYRLPLSQIKNLVGNRLKEHKTYQQLLEKEGKRCWTMQYDEFHMDILPCVPKDQYFIEPYLTAIKLTHKNKDGIYEPRFSNPYAYHSWFESRMEKTLKIEKRLFAEVHQVEIDKVPTYKVRTPLQKVIQILKRHRDICFQENTEDAPISIIITTLAAWAYNGEENVYEALGNILDKMPEHIQICNGEFWIENPVIKEENFADKWNTVPSKQTAFVRWLARARKELIEDPLSCIGIDSIAERFKRYLGQAPTDRALRSMGNDTRIARSRGSLYVNGLTGGLTTTATTNSKPVKEHTFFGK